MKEKSLIVLAGEDIPALYARKEKYIHAAEDGERYEEGVNARLVVQMLQTQSLFATARRLEFINPAFLLGKDESVPAAELLSALANIPAGTRVLCIVEGKLDRRRKFVKQILDLAEVYIAEFIPKWKVGEEAEMYVRRRGAKLTAGARRYLENVSEGWENVSSVFLSTECDKWLLMADGNEVTEAVIRDSLPSYMDLQIFTFWDHLLAGKRREVLAATPILFDKVEDELKNIGYLTAQLRYCLALVEMQAAGIPEPQIRKELGVNSAYRWKGLQASVRQVRPQALKALLLAIYDCRFCQRTQGGKADWQAVWVEFLGRRGV